MNLDILLIPLLVVSIMLAGVMGFLFMIFIAEAWRNSGGNYAPGDGVQR